MSAPTKQAPAKATPGPVQGTPAPVPTSKPKIDFNSMQEVPGGIIRHQTSDPLEGTPIPTQLAKSWAAKDAKGFGSTFTVGPVNEDVVEALRNMYRRGAANAGHGVAFSYSKASRALTVRAQEKKKFDVSPEAVAARAATRAANKAAKAAAK